MADKFPMYIRLRLLASEVNRLKQIKLTPGAFTVAEAKLCNDLFGAPVVKSNTDHTSDQLVSYGHDQENGHYMEIVKWLGVWAQRCSVKTISKSGANGSSLMSSDARKTLGLAVQRVDGKPASGSANQIEIQPGMKLEFTFMQCRFRPLYIVVSEQVAKTFRMYGKFRVLIDRNLGHGDAYRLLPAVAHNSGDAVLSSVQLSSLVHEGCASSERPVSEGHMRKINEYLFGTSAFEGNSVDLTIRSLFGVPAHKSLEKPGVLGPAEAAREVQKGIAPSDTNIHRLSPDVKVTRYGHIGHRGGPSVQAVFDEQNGKFEYPVGSHTVLRDYFFLLFEEAQRDDVDNVPHFQELDDASVEGESGKSTHFNGDAAMLDSCERAPEVLEPLNFIKAADHRNGFVCGPPPGLSPIASKLPPAAVLATVPPPEQSPTFDVNSATPTPLDRAPTADMAPLDRAPTAESTKDDSTKGVPRNLAEDPQAAASVELDASERGTVVIYKHPAYVLKTTNKQAISKPVPIPINGEQKTFKIIAEAKEMKTERGGWSWKKSKGMGTVKLRCEDKLAQDARFKCSITVMDKTVDVIHNFWERCLCEVEADFDFLAAVDPEKSTFTIVVNFERLH